MSAHGILQDEWIVSYASGSLSEAHALVVASHCEYHPELLEKVADAESIGGALIENYEPVALSEDMFESLMARLELEQSDMPASNDNGVLPGPLAQYIGKPLEELKWRAMGPGLAQVKLWSGPKNEKLWLLKAKGGAKIPEHDHNGLEMTLVLTGSYHVGEKQFTPGMLELADSETVNHQPVIDQGEDCICLVVTEAPIILHSFIGRMLQPFIGL